MWNGADVSAEELWIRAICRYALGHMSVANCLPYLEHAMDETHCLDLLHEHRLYLLVYQVLSKDFDAYVAPDFMRVLQQKSQHILKQQLGLMRVSKELHHAFEAHQIEHIFLKGPALNQILWGRQMMRYSGDLDLLIQPKDIFKAEAVLQTLKFTHALSHKFIRIHQIFQRLSIRKDVVYRRADLPQALELHWKTSATEFIVTSNKSLHLADEEYALYLCLHAAKHGWSRLIWLVDIVALIQVKKIDVARLQVLAKACHIGPVVDEAILLAQQWLGISLTTSDAFERLKKRRACLQKRIKIGKIPAKNNWIRTFRKIYYMNHVCSNRWCQLCLWTQNILGAIVSKCLLCMRKEKNA
ncbi:MAG: nucleotidyltransferase family protein [Legionellaceae bacterium]|jgi:hypothetical protein|nr:nucleotidyltransferase family protein [Legionellaceae bacterium]